MSKVILSEESLFIETEVTGDGANETAIEDAAGELSPVFVFEGFEEPGPMRVACVISSSVTSRSSRSRLRRSPKFPLAMPST